MKLPGRIFQELDTVHIRGVFPSDVTVEGTLGSKDVLAVVTRVAHHTTQMVALHMGHHVGRVFAAFTAQPTLVENLPVRPHRFLDVH